MSIKPDKNKAIRNGGVSVIRLVNSEDLHKWCHHLSPILTQSKNKHGILLVTDSFDSSQLLKPAQLIGNITIDIAHTLKEVIGYCHNKHDLIIVDLPASKLQRILETLRSNDLHSKISLLVANGRIIYDMTIAGLLPKYRAMPCSGSEIAALTNYIFAQESKSLVPRRPL